MLLWWALACVPDAEKPDDADGDGYGELDGDCDDGDGARHPGADEHCDGADEDCDGTVDEDPVDAPTGYLDADGDGVGGPAAVTACGDVGVAVGGDCDDTDPDVYPGAVEVCNTQKDEDCDGTAAGCVPDGEVPITADLELTSDGLNTFAFAVAPVGDHTGDGLGDVAVSAPERSAPADARGTPFVWVYGAAANGRLTPEQADASVVGFESAAQRAGIGLAGGDLDGDGQADLVLGAPGDVDNLYDYGAVYLLRGPLVGERAVSPFPLEVDYVAEADAAVYTLGEPFDHFGEVVVTLPDVDGDGFADLGVGAPDSSGSGRLPTAAGAAYVFPGAVDFVSRAPEALVRVNGDEAYGDVGRAILGLPDVDGDGYAELLVSGPSHSTGAGTVALFRRPVGEVSLNTADLRLDGPSPADRAGVSLAYVPETGQLLVGAPNDVSDELNDGAIWSVPIVDLGRGSFTLDEVAVQVAAGDPGDELGFSMSVGDVDGDDLTDAVYGSPTGGTLTYRMASGVGWTLTGTSLSLGISARMFDGDGDPFEDTLAGDASNNRALVWRGRGW